MANREAIDLMRSAWVTRRSSFEADPEKQMTLMTKAKDDLLTAVALCRDSGTPVELAQALHLLANVEHDMGKDDRAQSLWEEAVAILREADDVLQLAHKVRHLGDLHRHCGRLSEAETCYDEALALYREHDEPGSLLRFASMNFRQVRARTLGPTRTPQRPVERLRSRAWTARSTPRPPRR